jgi:hypothetical protein
LLGVGQDIEPFPPVRSANFRRTEYSCFNSVTKLSKVCVYDVEAKSKVSSDVLEEAPCRLDFSDDSLDVRPEVAGVIFAESLSGL